MNNLKTYPGTYPSITAPVLLHQYLLQHTKISPDAIAIISTKDQWTYRDLSNYSYEYADILDDRGLAAGDRIILELEPSPQAIALIVACSLLGLVFVPVSPETPPTRVEQILDLTEAQLHIKASSNKESIANSHLKLQGLLEGNSLKIEGKLPEEFRSQRSIVLESDLAYIIFTSGTTGNPKGIMMPHRAIVNGCHNLVNYFQLQSKVRLGTIAPLQFDLSLLDMGLALGSGATLVQIPRNLTLIPKRLVQYLQKHQVEQMHSVPSFWRLLLKYASSEIVGLENLTSILFAGESFPLLDLIKLQQLLPDVQMINDFGLSEAIACSLAEVPNPLPPDTKNLTIGFPHPGAEMLLLDDNQKEVNRPGRIGEIYLRGANLFSGYWKEPNATNAALITNPLNPLSGEKVFRTGDLAYKGLNGELYLAGRRDLQVKIMGNRVELEEVERRLREHPLITQAAAIAINFQESTLLAVFLVVDKNHLIPTVKELRLFCGKTMPNYMIPSEIHFLDILPITTNGKVNREALKTISSEQLIAL